MSLPLVTVVMPVYNQEDTLARALDSVLAQVTDFPVEILVGDDASSDRTLDICRQYESEHDNIRVVANSRNLGVAANYYNLVCQARGRFIADLAGDDEWCYSGKLQEQADVMRAYPNVTLCHTDWVRVDRKGRVEASNSDGGLDKFRLPLMPRQLLLFPLISHHPGPIVHSCTMMYRKDALERARKRWPSLFNDPDLVCEDLQLIVSMAALGDIAFLPRVTLRYHVHEGSITGTRHAESLFRFYDGSLRLTRALQRLHTVPDTLMRRCYAKMVPYIVDLAFRSHRLSLMLQALESTVGLQLPFASQCKVMLARMLFKN